MIKYPNKIIKQGSYKNYANRGMTLEAEINNSNEYYLKENIAVIYKKPTPIKVVKQVNERIVSAYFEKPSTTDYNGLYRGKYIDFEAKETKNVSFPLRNIHPHQIKHLESIIRHGGICFLIVRFVKINETYLLFGEDFISFITNVRAAHSPHGILRLLFRQVCLSPLKIVLCLGDILLGGFYTLAAGLI